MSRNTMMWRPTPTEPPPTREVPDRLARLLSGWLNDEHDPTRKPTREVPDELSIGDLQARGFLEGLVAAQVEGAAELLAALQHHGTVDLWWD